MLKLFSKQKKAREITNKLNRWKKTWFRNRPLERDLLTTIFLTASNFVFVISVLFWPREMDSDWKVDCSDDENYGLTYSSTVSDRKFSVT